MSDKRCTIAIGASFTAEPILPALNYWMEELAIPSHLVIAPYGQLLHQLHDPAGVFDGDSAGLNVLLIGIDRYVGPVDSDDNDQVRARQQRDLVESLSSAVARSPRPWTVIFCPAAPEAEQQRGTDLAAAESLLHQQLSGLAGVHVVTRAEMRATYPVIDYFDRTTAELADIPYTEAFFAALGTMVARVAVAITRPRRKVVVLDCDNTLWDGVCAEDGADGIRIGEPQRALQSFMRDLQAAGTLLCTCSKNRERDVRDVFSQRDDMLLKAEHIVAWRVNWESKARNIRSLADELKLGLDSFIFIDDDPVECADVEANCPGTLVLRLPRDLRQVERFLAHVWAFDRTHVTPEDRERTASYRAESERMRSRRASGSFAEFIRGLDLRVGFSPLDDRDLSRASQLTFRTNQMNLVTERRTVPALRAFRDASDSVCLLARVSDRFGDYGTAGLMLAREERAALKVDTFLLSCRALGRGIEHRMVAELGSIACSRGLDFVELPYRASERNAVALDFLRTIAADRESASDSGCVFVVPAANAAAVRYVPQESTVHASAAAKRREPVVVAVDERPSESEQQIAVAEHFHDPEQILLAVKARGERRRPEGDKEYVAPATTVERALAAIWHDILEIESVGVNDNFFEIGGDSLTLTRIIARVRDRLGVDLSFEAFFGAPTIAGLARVLPGLGSRYEPKVKAGPERWSAVRVDAKRPSRPVLVHGSRETSVVRSHEGAKISTICMVTHDRPEVLARGLASYVENAVRHGRDCRFLVADDTVDPDVAEAYRVQIRRVAEKYGVAVEYAGIAQKQRLARALISAGNIPPQVVELALFGVDGLPPSAGRNRNFALLDCVGEAMFSADDDTICRIASDAETPAPVALAANSDPATFRFFPDHETAVGSTAYVEEDLLGLHERLLGRRITDLLPDTEHTAAAGKRGGDRFTTRLAAGGGRVAMTTTGLIGDCGFGAPFGFWVGPMGSLLLDDRSLDRLCVDEDTYRRGCASREIHRAVSRPHVADHCFSMSTFVGIDARSLVPPFLPTMRGEDLVFGTTLWHSTTDAFFGHLPFSLVHAPQVPRRFWPGELFRTAAGIDLARLVIDCVRAFEPDDTGHDRARRLRSLGEHLIDLGARRRADFETAVLEYVARSTDRFSEAMETALQRRDGRPGFWAADVRTYLERLGKARQRPDYIVPLDLRRHRTVEEAAELAQELVASFGRLLYWWPEICTVARDLKRAGRLESASVS